MRDPRVEPRAGDVLAVGGEIPETSIIVATQVGNGARVVSCCPGFYDTTITRWLSDDDFKAYFATATVIHRGA